MFSSCMMEERGWTKPNDNGEYEVTEGVSACVFKALLVSKIFFTLHFHASDSYNCSAKHTSKKSVPFLGINFKISTAC